MTKFTLMKRMKLVRQISQKFLRVLSISIQISFYTTRLCFFFIDWFFAAVAKICLLKERWTSRSSVILAKSGLLRTNPRIELPNPAMTASGERKSVRCAWGMPNCARRGSEPRFREVSSLLQVFSRLLSRIAASSIRAVSSCTSSIRKKTFDTHSAFRRKKKGEKMRDIAFWKCPNQTVFRECSWNTRN